MTRAVTATVAGQRLRVTPWQGEQYIALVGPARTSKGPTAADIGRCLDRLAQRGVVTAVTPALSPIEADRFLRAGFTHYETLHLLARQLSEPPPATGTTRRAWLWHRSRVLDIDRHAFEHFWRFDLSALREARRATPTSRFRVWLGPTGPVGYAITGYAGNRGYLQRLAVDPDHQGKGVGSDLVNDGLRWLHRKGVRLALVNTQDRNVRALALYERLGFVRQREGLIVLRWDRTG